MTNPPVLRSRFAHLTSACSLILLQGLPLLLLATLTSLPTPTARAQALPPVEKSFGFAIVGIETFDLSGNSISNAGDVNGDGLADVIVGAPGANPLGRNGAGEAYVVFGKSDTRTVDLLDVRAGQGGFAIAGSAKLGGYDSAGIGVSGAGDVNGDGLADLLVGARGADPAGRTYAGESYVVFGKSDTATVDLRKVKKGQGGFVILGADAYDLSGEAVSLAGDVNGDGLADLLVGARDAEAGSVDETGLSYVIFGKTDTAPIELKQIEERGVGGFVIVGQGDTTRSGLAVSNAGDINGDGLDDVLVGAYGADPRGKSKAGETYVVFGKTDTLPIRAADLKTGQGGFVVVGIATKDYSGTAVSGAGDVNNDGLADFIVGAAAADVGGAFNAGESYVVFGKKDTRPIQLALVRAGVGGFGILGDEELARCGASVSEAGDINGDSLADMVMVCDRANPEGRTEAGEGYVVFGKKDTKRIDVQALRRGQGGYVIQGFSEDSPLGISSGGGGDINGDGRPDTLFGSVEGDRGENISAGISYVIFGKKNTLPIDLKERLTH